METKLAQAAVAGSLAPFWRRSRKTFVPLTIDECRRDGVPFDTLAAAGLIEAYWSGRTTCYRVTDAGRKAFRPVAASPRFAPAIRLRAGLGRGELPCG